MYRTSNQDSAEPVGKFQQTAAGSAGQMQSSALAELCGLIVVVKKFVNGTCQEGVPWVDAADL